MAVAAPGDLAPRRRQPNRSAAERRAQCARAKERAASRLVRAPDRIARHRGQRLSGFAQAFQEALAAAPALDPSPRCDRGEACAALAADVDVDDEGETLLARAAADAVAADAEAEPEQSEGMEVFEVAELAAALRRRGLGGPRGRTRCPSRHVEPPLGPARPPRRPPRLKLRGRLAAALRGRAAVASRLGATLAELAAVEAALAAAGHPIPIRPLGWAQ
ncbi:unnamed protein product, partial [Prorocentrum cordatum]